MDVFKMGSERGVNSFKVVDLSLREQVQSTWEMKITGCLFVDIVMGNAMKGCMMLENMM